LQHRPESFQIIGIGIVLYPEYGMGVAHGGHRGRMQYGIVDRPYLQLYHTRIAELLRKRNLLPTETRPSHVDRDKAVLVLLRGEEAGHRLKGEGTPARLGRKRLNDAAHAVA